MAERAGSWTVGGRCRSPTRGGRVLALYRYLGPNALAAVGSGVDRCGRRPPTQTSLVPTDEHLNWRVPLTGPDGQPMRSRTFTDRRAATLAEAVRAATTSPMSCW